MLKYVFDIKHWRSPVAGAIFPYWQANRVAADFLLPDELPKKAWESNAESSGQRIQIDDGLSALRWVPTSQTPYGQVLLVHAWGGRATQMYGFVPLLLRHGMEVIALDAPGHGMSPAQVSGPKMFIDSMLKAQEVLGCFHSAIGHGLGAASIALASTMGLSLQQLVMIAAPSTLANRAMAYAHKKKLPFHCREAFLQRIAESNAYNGIELNIGHAVKHSEANIYLLHDKDDKQVPYTHMRYIKSHVPGALHTLTSGLGHRKLIRSAEAHSLVTEFIVNNQVRTTDHTHIDSMYALGVA